MRRAGREACWRPASSFRSLPSQRQPCPDAPIASPPMSDGFDLGQEVAASLGSSQGAWRFIRRFTQSWLTPLTDEDGWTEDDLRAAERRLGLRLPPAIREAYALFGRRQDLTSVQDRLLDPDQLELDVTGEVLIYRVENQSVAVWGVPLAAMEQPDPPVVVARNFEDGSWEPFLERFSVGCVEMVLSESLFSAPGALSAHRDMDPATAELVAGSSLPGWRCLTIRCGPCRGDRCAGLSVRRCCCVTLPGPGCGCGLARPVRWTRSG